MQIDPFSWTLNKVKIESKNEKQPRQRYNDDFYVTKNLMRGRNARLENTEYYIIWNALQLFIKNWEREMYSS